MSASAPRTATSLTPPRKRERLVVWLILGGCLLLAAVQLLVEIGRPQVTAPREANALTTAVQTWRRQHQFEGQPWSYDRLTPYRDGRPQLSEAPGCTWLHMAAFYGLHEQITPQQAIFRGRLVSVAFMLLAVSAGFWAGMSIGGVTTASMTALVMLGSPLLMYYGRLATTDAVQMGLSMLSIAAALWATRPLRPVAGLARQAIGWGICGLALGAATLTAGPTALPTVVIPVLIMLLLAPHRVGHIQGLIAALLITALIVTPWAGYAHLRTPDAWRSWMMSMLPDPQQEAADLLAVAAQRLGWMLLGALPWSLWLLAALLQPFSTSSEGSRNRMFIGWTWFVTTAILLAAAPGSSTLRSVLLAVAAAAVLIGQLFRHGTDLSAAGRHARFWRWLRWPQWSLMLAVSLALPTVGLLQVGGVKLSLAPTDDFAEMPWFYWAGMAVVLLGMAVISLGPVLRHYPARAVICWSLWMATMVTLLSLPLARGPLVHSHERAAALRLNALAGDQPILYLTSLRPPGSVLMFYSDRVFAPVTSAQLDDLIEDRHAYFLLAPRPYEPNAPWRLAANFTQDELALWHRPALPRKQEP
ncbi:MAG: hypothetical protein IT445_14480 [Phycisphaeraceae bacterium]|nr:hypothetical protein [Phycisphaeraceae bacterium]